MTWTVFTSNPLGTPSTYICRTPEEVERKEKFFDRFGIGYVKEVY